MIWENASILVTRGSEAAFEQAVARAAPLFKAARGCRHLRLQRSVEEPCRYHLLVGWDSVEDHTVHFRTSPAFQEWRALAGPHFAEPPVVTHLTLALDAF